MRTTARAGVVRLSFVPLLLLGLLLGQAGVAQQPGIPVGAVFGLTGALAAFGVSQQRGVEVALEKVNAGGGVGGVAIRLILQDSGVDAQGAINVVNQFIDRDRVLVFLGPTLSTQGQAAFPISNRAGVPAIGVSTTAAGIPDIGPFVFRVSAGAAVQGPNSLRIAIPRLGVARVAQIHANDDVFSVSEAESFRNALREFAGVQLVRVETYSVRDTEFRAQITQVLDQNPDLIIINGLHADGAQVVRQLRAAGYRGRIIGGNGFNTVNISVLAGPAAEGLIVATAYSPTATNPGNVEFIKRFGERFKNDRGEPLIPDQFAAQSYTGLLVAVEALKRAEGALGRPIMNAPLPQARAAVRDALVTIRDFETPLGRISIQANGDVEQATFYAVQHKVIDRGGGRYGGEFEPFRP